MGEASHVKRFAPTFALLLALSLLFPGGVQASSDNTSVKFAWHVSDAFIQAAGEPPQTGSVARASDSAPFTGHRVRISATGTFNTASKKATGGGWFVHTDASGQVQGFGIFTATKLQSFTLSGCDGGPFPPNFCGGKAVLNVHISGTSTNEAIGHAEFDGVLTVNCLIGGAPGLEGIMLNIPGLVNFDTTEPSHHGETLFVTKSHSGDD